MFKKNIKGFILIIVLALFAAFLIYKQRKSTIKEELSDFAVKDTALIDKIFIADKKGSLSLVERKGNAYWTINGKLKARQDAINTLLSTIANVSIKSPVPKAALKNILTQLSSTGIKTEIYIKGKLAKTYYVGGQDMDGSGTYMMIENSLVPFVTEIPGFQGFLTTRYIADPSEWRDKHIFSCKGNEISELSMMYNQKPEMGFKITMRPDYSVSLSNLQGQSPKFDTATVKEYLTVFTDVPYDSFVRELKPASIDSIRKLKPFHEIKLTTRNGQQFNIKTFPVKAKKDAVDKEGHPLAYDLDYMYAALNDTDFVYVQYYSFDQILKPIDYFKIGVDVMLKSK